jgi:hypothetical protein
MMEANKHGWRTTAHQMYDGGGAGDGVGSGHVFSASEYGPGASHVDTNQPFRASISFATDPHGRVEDVFLSLQGKQTLTASVVPKDYALSMTYPLKAGMTPVMSYWTSSNMMWLDSMGAGNQTGVTYDGSGDDGCPWTYPSGYPSADNQDTCASGVPISDVKLAAYSPDARAVDVAAARRPPPVAATSDHSQRP